MCDIWRCEITLVGKLLDVRFKSQGTFYILCLIATSDRLLPIDITVMLILSAKKRASRLLYHAWIFPVDLQPLGGNCFRIDNLLDSTPARRIERLSHSIASIKVARKNNFFIPTIEVLFFPVLLQFILICFSEFRIPGIFSDWFDCLCHNSVYFSPRSISRETPR